MKSATPVIPGNDPTEVYLNLLSSSLGPIARAHVQEQLEAEFVRRGYLTFKQCVKPIQRRARR